MYEDLINLDDIFMRTSEIYFRKQPILDKKLKDTK